MGGLQDIATVSELEAVTRDSPYTLVYFWAGWCEPCKQMDAVLEELANLHSSKGVRFLRVEAEEAFEVSERCQVSVVPYIVMYRGPAVAEKVEGYNIPALHATLKQLLASAPSPAAAPAAAPAAVRADPPAAADDTVARIKQLLAGSDILLFMKGSPEQPRCGFSRKVVDALRQTGLAFDHFDILEDERVRQELKAFSNWPTYPQLYVNGELLGGCDIVLEMQASGELKAAIQEQLASQAGSEDALHSRLKALVSAAPVMLFMKGSPAEPRCGFSRKVVDALREASISFSHFDILKDEEVRQGLKEFSKWPSYPQLYVQGELVGGCDIVLEMRDAGELKPTVEDMLSAAPPASNGVGNGTGAAPGATAGIETRIKRLLASAPVLLFMKGSPQEPRCGFSRKVADALAAADVAFEHIDILQDDDIRQGLKKFSNWPTYPQLYVNSDLVGGCDIILELQQSGELRPTIQDMLQAT